MGYLMCKHCGETIRWSAKNKLYYTADTATPRYFCPGDPNPDRSEHAPLETA